MKPDRLTEFVALSKCLPALCDVMDEEPQDQRDRRAKLAVNTMDRMQQLLDKDKTRRSAENILNMVDAENKAETEDDMGPPLQVRGTQVVTEDTELAGECHLLRTKVRKTILAKLEEVTPDDCPGVVIEVTQDGLIQAYAIPDPDSDRKLSIFKYDLTLT